MEDPGVSSDARFDRWAGFAAIAGAVLSLVYAVTFVVTKTPVAYSLALTAGSLLSTAALFAVYARVKPAGSLAALGLVLALAGTLGAAVHGAYDIAVVLHPGAAGPTDGGPFPVDPRGFLTFGVAGLGVLLLSAAGLSVGRMPRNLLFLGLVLGVLLVVIYLGRLIILDPTNLLVLGPAALAGLIVSPAWYGWLGWLLLKRTA